MLWYQEIIFSSCYAILERTVVKLYLKFKLTQAHIDEENEDRNWKFSRLLLPCFAWFVFIYSTSAIFKPLKFKMLLKSI